jgi:hypothetical protein
MPNEHLEPHHHADESISSSADSNRKRDARLRVPSRSPHPYHRRGTHETFSTEAATPPPGTPDNGASAAPSDAEKEGEEFGTVRAKWKEQVVLSPSESGTEADDEGYGFIKALPAPPLRPRKGLRDVRGTGAGATASPPLTPSALDEDSQRFMSIDSAASSKQGDKGRNTTDEEARAARAKFVKRRRAELIRRTSELALLLAIGMLAVREGHVWIAMRQWHRGTLSQHTQL